MTVDQLLPRQSQFVRPRSRSLDRSRDRSVGRSFRPTGLPAPEERRRLREQWGLSTRQVAVAFGVKPATVRSWESGRSAPRGGRRDAYRRFLAGLAQHGALAGVGPRGGGPVRAAEARRPVVRPVGNPGHPGHLGNSKDPVATAPPSPVRAGAVVRRAVDPVSPERVRRLRLLGAAACLWSLALWVILTCPPPL
ncbi:helix-turn-helix domain-containing protein [Streptomyces sp. NPDC048606]|uniref:helix-turn-helix domain-containing protein n=1 Tax=Streptomyces sp. NPDC048606 TaxID=3154726 RepID=UPI003443FC60